MTSFQSQIRIGTSGFSFPDWKGVVYPLNLKDRDMLRYYAEHLGFDTVEINSTYYAIPSLKSFEGMVKKTPDGFEFTVKAHRSMTHDPFDTRLEKKPEDRETESSFQKFSEAIKPLKESKRLGAVLLQFPVFFYNSQKNKDYILLSKEKLRDVPLVVEFRHRSWMREDTFQFLRENGIGFCTVDEPDLPRLMPFVNRVTSEIGYMRFHGRNKNWFNVPVSERYDYLYSEEELKVFVSEVRKMADAAPKIYAYFNNCHRGQAVRNALAFREMLRAAV